LTELHVKADLDAKRTVIRLSDKGSCIAIIDRKICKDDSDRLYVLSLAAGVDVHLLTMICVVLDTELVNDHAKRNKNKIRIPMEPST
jgi:hypothetical protein